MKIFGSISKLVNLVFSQNSQAITLRPNQSTTYTAARDLQLPPGDAAHVLVSADSTQVLTGKTVDGDNNTVQDLPVTAIKTVLADAGKVIMRNASGVPTSTTISGDVTLFDTGVVSINDSKITSSMIVDGAIMNVDVNTNAAIAGSKITPAFGSQNVSTTGTLAAGATTVTTLLSSSSSLQLGTTNGPSITNPSSELTLTTNPNAQNSTTAIVFKGSWSGGGTVTERLRLNEAGVSTASPLSISRSAGNDQLKLARTSTSAEAVWMYTNTGVFEIAQDSAGVPGTAYFRAPVGSLAASAEAGFFMKGTTSQDNPVAIYQAGDNNNQGMMKFYTAATSMSSATFRGGIRKAAGVSTPEFYSASDRRIKTGITPNSDPILDRLCAVELVKYDMKDGSNAPQQLGVIAQQLAEVFPSKVVKTDNGLGEELPEGQQPWTIGSTWHYELIAAIQELAAKNKELEARIAVLESGT